MPRAAQDDGQAAVQLGAVEPLIGALSLVLRNRMSVAQDLVAGARRLDAEPALAELPCEGPSSLRVLAVTCPVASRARGRALTDRVAVASRRPAFAASIEVLA